MRTLSGALAATLIATIASCTTRSAPRVAIRLTQPDLLQVATDLVAAGANAWSDATGVQGGYFDPKDSTEECGLVWFDDHFDNCQVIVDLTFIPMSELETPGEVGQADIDARTIIVAAEFIVNPLATDAMISTVAHEVGHCLWHTDEHLPSDKQGIMSAHEDRFYTVPTDADLAYVKLHTDGWFTD